MDRIWTQGDEVTLQLPMAVERIMAHPNVKANHGLVALQRGPVVYGIEGLDNAGRIDVVLPADPQFQIQFRPDLLGGLVTVSGQAVNHRPFLAIPFYALANREKSKQVVWLHQKGDSVAPINWESKLYLPSFTAPRTKGIGVVPIQALYYPSELEPSDH
jgi:hypothetical protein